MTRTILLFLASSSALAAGVSTDAPDEASIAPTALLSVVLLMCSAFFSSSETALFGLQPVELEEMSDERGEPVRSLLRTPRETLASILIGNETVNIALSTVTASMLLQAFPDLPWLNVVVLAPVLLIFGEVLPKTFAFRFRTRLTPKVAPWLLRFSNLVAPVRFTLGRIADAALVLTGGSSAPRQAELREAHLRALLDHGRKDGSIQPVEQEILHKVFEFGAHTVAHLMTPRSDVFTINLLMPWDELIESVRSLGHSRVPVWQGSPDNIVGILVVKRLLRLIAAQRRQAHEQTGKGTYHPSHRQIHKLLHPPRFIPKSKRADELLAEFQTRRSHMAIVVDEVGSTLGVVTLDDLLNELVGEIHDETDKEDPAVTPIDATTYKVCGSMAIDDFIDRFHLTLAITDEQTLGDFVQSLSDSPIFVGTEVEASGVRYRVESIDDDHIMTIMVDLGRLDEEDDPTQEGQDYDTEEDV